MNDPEFLQRDAVIFLHDQALRTFGGVHGIRDEGLLDSALARPVNRLRCEGHSDLFDLAAAYAFGIAKNHPCHDGNKRTAWASCVLFLKVNGAGVRRPALGAVLRMLDLVEERLTESGFAAWLRPQPR